MTDSTIMVRPMSDQTAAGWIVRAIELGLKVTSTPLKFGAQEHVVRSKQDATSTAPAEHTVALSIKQSVDRPGKLDVATLDSSEHRLVMTLSACGLLTSNASRDAYSEVAPWAYHLAAVAWAKAAPPDARFDVSVAIELAKLLAHERAAAVEFCEHGLLSSTTQLHTPEFALIQTTRVALADCLRLGVHVT